MRIIQSNKNLKSNIEYVFNYINLILIPKIPLILIKAKNKILVHFATNYKLIIKIHLVHNGTLMLMDLMELKY